MKFLKNTLAIVVLFAIGSVDARGLVSGGTTTTQPSVQQSTPTQVRKNIQERQQEQGMQKEEPRKAGKTFKQVAEGIMSARPANVWNGKTNLLQDNFVKEVVADCMGNDLSWDNNLSEDQLNILLMLARDKHAQFTGISKTDTARLEALEMQRDRAKSFLNKDETLTSDPL